MVNDNSVVLFRHVTVAAPQASFKVSHRNVKLHASKCYCHAGVDIPRHKYHVGPLLKKQWFNTLQNPSGLYRVGA